MVLWIVIGVLLLFFIFVTYKSAPVWNAAHLALASGIFVFAIIFLILAASNLRTRLAWMQHYEKLTAETTRLADEKSQLTATNLTTAAELDRIVQLRGQVWRNMIPVDRNADGFILNTAAWGDADWRRVGMVAEEEPVSEPAPVETPAEVPAEPAAEAPAATDGAGEQPAPDAAPADGTETTEPAAADAAAEATDPAADPAAAPPAEADPSAAPAPTEGSSPAPPAAPSAPAQPPGGTGKPHGIQAKMIVHAFVEAPISLAFVPEPLRAPIQALLLKDSTILEKDTKGRLRIPFVYLGEFRVEQVEGNFINLQPNYPLPAPLIAIASQSQWTLYDSPPRDSREVFQGADADQVAKLFAAMMNLPPEAVQPLVQEYLRDGQDAQPADPADQRWVEVKFLKDHTVEVDVPAGAEATLPDKPFDVNGRARDAYLRQGGEGPATVRVDQQGVFDRITAQALVAAGVAQPVRDVYQRRLRDYAYEFQMAHHSIRANLDRGTVVQRNLEIMQQALGTLEKQIEYRTQEREKLQGDLRGFQKEQTVLQNYLAELQARIDELRATLKTLYLNNQRLVGTMAG